MISCRLYYWFDKEKNLHSIFAAGGFIGREKITTDRKRIKMLPTCWKESAEQGKIELIKQKGD